MHADDTRSYPLALVVFDPALGAFSVAPMLRDQVRAPESLGPFASEDEAVTAAQARYPQARIVHAIYQRARHGQMFLEREPGTTRPTPGGRSLWYRPHP